MTAEEAREAVSESAEETAEQPLLQMRVDARSVLVSSIWALAEALERSPTASEVMLEMRNRTYGGFSPKRLGYKRFREFLSDMARQGIVQLDETRPGDFAVDLPARTLPSEVSRRPIRPDIWRAFVDWRPGLLRFYDTVQDKAVMLPREPAPLEPEKIQGLRKLLEAEPGRFIAIEPVPIEAQLRWMRDFASELKDRQLGAILLEALEGQKPAKLFLSVLRNDVKWLTAWRRRLTANVRGEVEVWRQQRVPIGIHVTIDQDTSIDEAPERHVVASESMHARQAESFENLLEVMTRRIKGHRRSDDQSQGGVATGHERKGGEDLRARVHAAIDRMPLDEIKELKIPLGYLFEDE